MRIDAGAKLVGRVVELDSGAPLEGVNVHGVSATTRVNVDTGKDGSFTLDGLGAGPLAGGLPPGQRRDPRRRTHRGRVKPGGAHGGRRGHQDDEGQHARKDGGSFAGRGRIGFTVALVDGKPVGHRRAGGFPGGEGRAQAGRAGAGGERQSVDGLGNGALDYLAAGKIGEPLVVKVQPRDGGPPREVTLHRVPMDYVSKPPGAPPPGRGRPAGHPRARRRAARARPRARRSWGESPRNVERESRLHLAPLAGRGRGVCAPGEGRPLKNRAPSPFPSPRCAGRGQTIVGLRAVGSKPA